MSLLHQNYRIYATLLLRMGVKNINIYSINPAEGYTS